MTVRFGKDSGYVMSPIVRENNKPRVSKHRSILTLIWPSSFYFSALPPCEQTPPSLFLQDYCDFTPTSTTLNLISCPSAASTAHPCWKLGPSNHRWYIPCELGRQPLRSASCFIGCIIALFQGPQPQVGGGSAAHPSAFWPTHDLFRGGNGEVSRCRY
jgi:hypothetical protein